jgi:diguanylate cyclase (GGDEF)-like protein
LYLPPERVPAMPNVLSLDPRDLERFLERRRANPPHLPLEMDLAENLVAVLRKANEFVPSEAGSILLDDPREKHADRSRNRLTFLAVFGDRAEALVGQSIPADRGIAGWTYQTGRAYYSTDVAGDPHFDARVDRETAYSTRSLVAIPIRIESEVCGVLELLNRHGANGYGPEDRDLLEIFAGYISIAIQNVLDGRIAQEVARRDNLTGLYNDRFLHSALDHAVEECGSTGEDLALLFLDLDFFKHINDTHGHLTGSQVLREVGALLRRRFEGGREITARYGGDEFVIVVPGADAEGGRALAEELRRAISGNAFCARPGEISSDVLDLRGLTCSVGVSHLSGGGGERTPAEVKRRLLRDADAAMYRAKESGRDRVAVAVPADRSAPPTALTPPKGA